MTKEVRARDFVGHMLDAIARIERYIALTPNEDAFERNQLIQDAVVKNLAVLGEAAQNIRREAPEFAAHHANVPWELIYGMRNRVIHGYFDINTEVVWQTVKGDLPDLRKALERIQVQPS